jgi:hypothetical protein
LERRDRNHRAVGLRSDRVGRMRPAREAALAPVRPGGGAQAPEEGIPSPGTTKHAVLAPVTKPGLLLCARTVI